MKALAWGAVVGSVAVLAHSTGINAPFLWDDHWLVFSHPVVSGALPPWSAFSTTWWQSHPDNLAPYYRPLVVLSLAFDRWLFGPAPAGFHATNLALHAGASILVFAAALQAGVPRRSALLAAALFAALPRLTENVQWVSGRTDILATVFLLAALLVHQGKAPAGVAAVGVFVLVFAAQLCKESSLVAPALLLIFDLARSTVLPPQVLLRRLAPAMAAVAIAVLLRVVVTGVAFPPAFGAASATLALRTVAHYAWMLLTPTDPAARIGDRLAGFDGWAVAGVAVLAALAAWAAAVWQKGMRSDLAPAGWALLALVPVLNIVPASIFNLAADRFLYLPCAGLALLVARRLAGWDAAHPRATLLCVSAVLSLFAFATSRRGLVYNDEVAYWTEAARRAPPNDAAVHLSLGEALLAAGRGAEAAESMGRVLAIGEKTGMARSLACKVLVKRATALSAAGDDARAREELEQNGAVCKGLEDLYVPTLALTLARALEMDVAERVLAARMAGESALRVAQLIARAREALAGDPPHLAAARALDILGAKVKAEARYRQAVARGEPGASLQLARWLLDHERHEDAASELATWLGSAPQDPRAHYWLGYALLSLGRGEDGRSHLRRALELDPHMPNRAAIERLVQESQ